jgi:hypothetical protein
MKYIWCIVLLLILISCRKFKFTQSETIIMNSYNVGDTLQFQSLTLHGSIHIAIWQMVILMLVLLQGNIVIL